MKGKKLVALLLALTATAAIGGLTSCKDKTDDPDTQLEQTQFTVSFDTQGGSAVSEQGVFGNGKVTEPGAPTKYGYDFIGWYKTADGNEKWNFETDVVKGHTTIYARWEIKDATADTYFDFATEGDSVTISAKAGQTLPADVVLPSQHEGKKITAIKDGAFEGQAAVKSVLVPDTVKNIGGRAFRNCTNLEQVLGAENVETIGGAAFSGTKYDSNLTGGEVYLGKCLYKYAGGMYTDTEVTVKEGTLGIAAGAFQDMQKLTKVTLPSGLKYIGNYAFGGTANGTGLKEVVIPESVLSVGDNAFRNAKSLATVTIGKGVKEIGASAFAGTAITNLTYNANATVNDNSFATVSAASTLTFGNDVTALPVNVTNKFTGLTTVTLGTGITEIPDSAFEGLSSLATVNINGTLTSIGALAFKGTGITEFTVNKEITSIGGNAFANCAELVTVNYNAVNATGTTASALAFEGCSKLKTVTVGADVTAIPAYLFKNCAALDTLTLGANVASIGTEAFYGTAIATLTVPAKVATIGNSAFGNCASLATVNYNATNATYEGTTTIFAAASSVTIGGGVTKIPAYFVKGNTVLTSVTLPAGVSVGDYAFNGCTALATIEGYDTVGTVGAQAFEGSKYYEDNMADGLLIQGSTITGYRGEMPANFTLDAQAIPTGKTVTAIAAEAFKNKTNLVAVALPASVVTIGTNAFEGTSVAGTLDLSNVTEIGAGAFKGLTGVTAVTLNASVSKIGAEAFSGCSEAVMTLTANNLTELGTKAFYDCAKLTSVEVNGVAEIPVNCFSGTGLTSVTLGNTVETVGDSWATLTAVTTFSAPSLKHAGENGFRNLKAAFDFSNLVSLGRYAMRGVGGANTEITFGENLESFAENLFSIVSVDGVSGNTNVTKVTIKSSKITEIPAYAFAGCTNLTSVTFDDCKVTTIRAYAFHTCKLTSFDFTNVTTIGEYAFCDSGLTSVSLGENLESIEQSAFDNCKSLVGTLTVGQKLTSVAKNAFSDSRLTSVTVKSNVKIIGSGAFGIPTLKEAVIENGVEEIGDAAFSLGYTTHDAVVTVPTSVTSIGDYAFAGWLRVIMTGSVDASFQGKNTFNYTQAIVVPDADFNTYKASEKWAPYKDLIFAESSISSNGVVVVDGELVKYVSLDKSIEIPAGVTSIAKGALAKVETITVATDNTALSATENVVFSKDGTRLVYYPAKLTAASYEVPATVTAIEANAFYNAAITELTFQSEVPPTLGENAFENVRLTKITVPAGKGDVYKAAEGFSAYASLIVASGEAVQEFVISENVLVKYNGTSATVVIPDEVTSIAVGAFEGCNFITELTIGKNLAKFERDTTTTPFTYGTSGLTGVTTLNFNSIAYADNTGTTAFFKNIMPALQTINVGEGVTRLPNYAFSGAAATKVVFPSTLKTIGQRPLNGMTSLTTIDWGESQVTTFENDAFRADSDLDAFSFTEFTIPASVTSIGNFAFYYQSKLTKIVWNADPTSVGSSLFGRCTALASFEFAEGVTKIPGISAMGITATNVTSLKLPTTVKTIAANAFNGCANMVCEFVMPTAIESIGASAFNGCAKLTGQLTIPSTLKSIGGYAFANSGLSGDWSTITVSKELFQNCGEAPFDGCVNLVGANIRLPEGLTKWSTDFYSGTGITSVDFTGVTEIGDYAFYNCVKLVECDLSKVTKIGDSSFEGCTGLVSVNLDSVITIADNAFKACTSLHTAVIGSSCTSIGGRSFGNGDVTIEVTFKGTTPPTITDNSFGSSSKFAGKLYVPAASVDTYKAATNWTVYADKIQAIPAEGGETGGETGGDTPVETTSLEALPADNKNN